MSRARTVAGALVPVLAGLVQAASIAWPWTGQPIWWLQIASLAALAGVVRRAPNWRRGALAAWLFATSWLAGTFWWLFISMHVYGGLASPLAAVAVLALAAFLALDYALAGAIAVKLRCGSPVVDGIVFAAAWLLAELMRGSLYTGLPWGAAGYAHVEGPLAALAPWIGVYGICAVAAMLAAWLAALVSDRQAWRSTGAWVGWAAAALILVAARVVALPGEDSGAPMTVALLQGNIPQDEKFERGSGIPLALDWYAQQLGATRAALTVAPETAIPLLPQQLPPAYLDMLADRFATGGQAALIGIPLGDAQKGYTNSVIGLRAPAPAYRYDKHHLVPFGEFIPPFFRWFTDLMNIPLGDFNRGGVPQPTFDVQGQRLAPNICYEDLFGEQIGAGFRDAARAPTILVNVSNIGWFGDSIAIDQHLQISRMRTLEFDRPMVRATNTGATAIIDHTGRVTQLLPRFTRGVLTGDVRGRDSITPYAWWVSRLGLAPLWAVAVLVLGGGAWRGMRRARP